MSLKNALVLVLLAILLATPLPSHAEDAPAQEAPPPDDGSAPTTERELPVPAPPPNPDPLAGEAPLPAHGGWHASLVIDNDGVGIWTVKSQSVFEQLGCPEVIGLDDKGRCNVLMSYSGRWTPIRVLDDGKWLGGLDFGEVDPRVENAEIYTGSQRGNIYQVRAYGQTLLDGRLIAALPGREIHTILAGDLDPRTEGAEVIVFTRPGGLYRLTPTGAHGAFVTTHLMDLPGRVRDAVVLDPGRATADAGPEIVTVSRTGRLEVLQITRDDGPRWQTIYRDAMGLGRIAQRPPAEGARTVLYATHDDGRILRFERGADGAWSHEVVYHGPPGPRGVAAGRFDADPAVETIAIFGYSGRVELLSRREGRWTAELLFVDRDKGHWMCTAELDGRNATREILTSGYSGRIVLLARPPGYGRPETASPRVPVALPPTK